MASILNVKAFYWVIPAAAKVKIIDVAWHKMGDVNWDGVIDQADLDMAAAAYGSYPGASNWNPDCDLDGDGMVDIYDIALSARNFGKTAPELAAPFSVTVDPGRCVLIATYQDYILVQDFKVIDKTSITILFEFNIFKGRIIVLGGFGAGGNLGLVQRSTTESIPEIHLEY